MALFPRGRMAEGRGLHVRGLRNAMIFVSGWRRMAAEGRVVAVDGSTVEVAVESVCVHGDTPGAVELARAVRGALERAGLTVGRFAA